MRTQYYYQALPVDAIQGSISYGIITVSSIERFIHKYSLAYRYVYNKVHLLYVDADAVLLFRRYLGIYKYN